MGAARAKWSPESDRRGPTRGGAQLSSLSLELELVLARRKLGGSSLAGASGQPAAGSDLLRVSRGVVHLLAPLGACKVN